MSNEVVAAFTGDTLPVIEMEWLEEDGVTPIDLTGGEVVFRMALPGATVNEAKGVCTLTDPTNGKCEYQFLTGDLITPARQIGEGKYTRSDGKIITAPHFNVNVQKSLPD